MILAKIVNVYGWIGLVMFGLAGIIAMVAAFRGLQSTDGTKYAVAVLGMFVYVILAIVLLAVGVK